MNLCRVGGVHFKAMRFWTTAPEEATNHMEVRCDHAHRHPPCTGRDSNGEPRTRKTSAYTPTMVMMIAAVAAVLAGTIGGSKLADPQLHDSTHVSEAMYWAQHENTNKYSISVDHENALPTTCDEWADFSWTTADTHECFLVRDKLQTYYDRTRNEPAKELKGHEAVIIVEDCPPKVKQRVQAKVIKHKRVFNEGLGGMPLAVKGGEVTIQLKPDAKATRCPRPKWGHGE